MMRIDEVDPLASEWDENPGYSVFGLYDQLGADDVETAEP